MAVGRYLTVARDGDAVRLALDDAGTLTRVLVRELTGGAAAAVPAGERWVDR